VGRTYVSLKAIGVRTTQVFQEGDEPLVRSYLEGEKKHVVHEVRKSIDLCAHLSDVYVLPLPVI
jgi:hypothetical protein